VKARKRAIFIGTSGWSYTPWRGPFFPEILPSRSHLQFYAALGNAETSAGLMPAEYTPDRFGVLNERIVEIDYGRPSLCSRLTVPRRVVTPSSLSLRISFFSHPNTLRPSYACEFSNSRVINSSRQGPEARCSKRRA
jgi:hypothetical protein